MQSKEVTPTIVIADQPTREELDLLRSEGYVGVVNLREEGEEAQPLDPGAEGEAARAAGLDYLHAPIGKPELIDSPVAEVFRFLDEHAPGKVLVHCRKGGRAAAIVLLHQARARGWTDAEALERGKEAGLTVEGALREKVERYLKATDKS